MNDEFESMMMMKKGVKVVLLSMGLLSTLRAAASALLLDSFFSKYYSSLLRLLLLCWNHHNNNIPDSRQHQLPPIFFFLSSSSFSSPATSLSICCIFILSLITASSSTFLYSRSRSRSPHHYYYNYHDVEILFTAAAHHPPPLTHNHAQPPPPPPKEEPHVGSASCYNPLSLQSPEHHKQQQYHDHDDSPPPPQTGRNKVVEPNWTSGEKAEAMAYEAKKLAWSLAIYSSYSSSPDHDPDHGKQKPYANAMEEEQQVIGINPPIESAWKAAITGGQKSKPKKKHLWKSSETWEEEEEVLLPRPKPKPIWKQLRKSLTFDDALLLGQKGGLVREEDPSLSKQELNKMVEDFIKRGFQDRKLQRQQSLLR